MSSGHELLQWGTKGLINLIVSALGPHIPTGQLFQCRVHFMSFFSTHFRLDFSTGPVKSSGFSQSKMAQVVISRKVLITSFFIFWSLSEDHQSRTGYGEEKQSEKWSIGYLRHHFPFVHHRFLFLLLSLPVCQIVDVFQQLLLSPRTQAISTTALYYHVTAFTVRVCCLVCLTVTISGQVNDVIRRLHDVTTNMSVHSVHMYNVS